MIHTESIHLRDILGAGDYRIVVPGYQRNFAWGRDEVEELLSDFKAAQVLAEPQLFLGTFVFNMSNAAEWAVIDGQQRLTTLSLVLIAARRVAQLNGDIPQATKIQEKINFTDDVSGHSVGPRIVVSPSIRDLFEYMCKDDWHGDFPDKISTKSVRRQRTRLKPLYDYIHKQLEAYSAVELAQFLRVVYGAYVVRINIEKEEDAFDIFERTNARGMELNAADLLKNNLFQNKASSNLLEKWDEILENSENTMLRMLKYFWVSKFGYILKSDLYRKIKGYGAQVGSDVLVNELYIFSRFYKAVRSDDVEDDINWMREYGCDVIAGNQSYRQQVIGVFQALKLFKVTQAYPLLFAMLTSYARAIGDDKSSESKNTKVLIKTLLIIEKYHFINTAVCERIGNDVEKLYAGYAEKFHSEVDFIETAHALIEALKEKKADRSEFIARFCDISYGTESQSFIPYVFDRINNHNAVGGQVVAIYNPDKSILKRNYNIEHFLPQNPAEETSEEAMENVDNIGNLLIISRHTNSSLGNMSPAEKIEFIKDPKHNQNLVVVQDFIKKYSGRANNWGKEAISHRAKEMASEGYDHVWNF